MTAGLGAVLVAVLAGAAISVQSLFSGIIGRRLGVMEAAFVIHLVGLALAGVLMVAMRGGNLAAWRAVPWHACVAGLLGVGIVASVSYAVPRLGLATALTLTIVAQLLLGALLDNFGWLGASPHPLTATRAVGMAVLIVGTWLVVR